MGLAELLGFSSAATSSEHSLTPGSRLAPAGTEPVARMRLCIFWLDDSNEPVKRR
jgi:hypothetical protein